MNATTEQIESVDSLITRLSVLVSGAEYLTKPFFGDRLIAAVRQAHVISMSPWMTRADAAAYWRCSDSEIHAAVQNGVLTKHMRGGTPLFLKEEGDAALKCGKWVRRTGE